MMPCSVRNASPVSLENLEDAPVRQRHHCWITKESRSTPIRESRWDLLRGRSRARVSGARNTVCPAVGGTYELKTKVQPYETGTPYASCNWRSESRQRG